MMVKFDVSKIQQINEDVNNLRDKIFDELVMIFPGPAADDNWSKDQVKVTILPDQPEKGLKVRIEYPRTVPAQTRLSGIHCTREVTIYPDGSTSFSGMTIRPRMVADYRQKLMAG